MALSPEEADALWRYLVDRVPTMTLTKHDFTLLYAAYRQTRLGAKLPNPAAALWYFVRSHNARFAAANDTRIVLKSRDGHIAGTTSPQQSTPTKASVPMQQGSPQRTPTQSSPQRANSTPTAEVAGRGFECHVCRVFCSSLENLELHERGVDHQKAFLSKEVRTRRPELEKDKFGVSVEISPEELPSMAIPIGAIGELPFSVTSSIGTRELVAVLPLPFYSNITIDTYLQSDPKIRLNPPRPLSLYPKKEYTCQVSFRGTVAGYYRFAIAFKFAGGGKEFSIWRFLEVEVYDSTLREITKASTPYERWHAPARHSPGEVVSHGEKPAVSSNSPLPVRPLPSYFVPLDIRRALTHNGEMVAEGKSPELEALEAKLKQPLTDATYGAVFQTLLWAEELQMEIEIRRYDMTTGLTKTPKGLLRLRVPGLAEKRPSVQLGDKVYATFPNKPNEAHAGYVHLVEAEHVLLHFNPAFVNSYPPGSDLKIRFEVSRVPLRRMHDAVLRWSSGVSQTLPLSNILCTTTNLIRWFDPNLNDEQKTAVFQIAYMPAERVDLPYVLFGPPGTGKTVTVVECIKQIWKYAPADTRILACAPSNAAADLLVDRLSKSIPKMDMLRLVAMQRLRTRSDVPPNVLEYTYQDKQQTGNFAVPPLETLSKYKVVVSTCISAGLLVAAGIQAGHFTHVFVDEAAQAPEPETLVVMAGLVAKGARVVLAGDHRQLGPIIRSGIALRHSLDRSLMERLCDTVKAYQLDAFGLFPANQITQLIRNYRSNRAIIELPNRMFYLNKLKTMADEPSLETLHALTESLRSLEDFPVVWHGVTGKDEREGNSPSWFNQAEIAVVIEWLKKIQENPGWKCNWKQVGVITPYRKQAQKLRLAAEKLNFRDLKIGSTEEFQGEERRVIIISTVRSSPEHIDHDRRFALGFLQNPKRFNVAVTRAQALLVIIGNPRLLCRDAYWRSLLEYCILNGSYRGEDFTLDSPDADLEGMLSAARSDLDANDEDTGEEDKEIAGGGFFEQ